MMKGGARYNKNNILPAFIKIMKVCSNKIKANAAPYVYNDLPKSECMQHDIKKSNVQIMISKPWFDSSQK